MFLCFALGKPLNQLPENCGHTGHNKGRCGFRHRKKKLSSLKILAELSDFGHMVFKNSNHKNYNTFVNNYKVCCFFFFYIYISMALLKYSFENSSTILHK